MTAPAGATAAVTRKAACIPLMHAGWLRVVITPAIRGGVLAVTSATPTVTALFAAASCGRSIVLQLKNPGAGPAGFQHSRIRKQSPAGAWDGFR